MIAILLLATLASIYLLYIIYSVADTVVFACKQKWLVWDSVGVFGP